MFLLVLLMVLILLILSLIMLFSLYPLKVAGAFNSELQQDVHIMVTWLNPFFKGLITRHDGKTVLTIKLLGNKVFTRELIAQKVVNLRLISENLMDYINLARNLKIDRIKLYASYGFQDPSVTGMLCGAISFISQYIEIDELYNNGDFTADQNYFNISAEAEINGVLSLIRILRRRIPLPNLHLLSAHK